MKANDQLKIRKQIRRLIILFMIFLVLSGVTAFPLVTELSWLNSNAAVFPHELQQWISRIYIALKETNDLYPQLAYGTDWLAFAHLVIAVAFVGPLMDPVRNIWVIRFGIIACLMVFPLALIAGPFRGIPFYWQLIDCSFGLLGLLPLISCHRKIILLEQTNKI